MLQNLSLKISTRRNTMSFFDMFKKTNTKTLAKKIHENTNHDPMIESLNNVISETELSNILSDQQSSMVKGEEYFMEGINLAQDNKKESAIEAFTKSIDCNDGASGPFLNRGVVYHQLGIYEKAVKDYKKAIELETVENTGSLDIAKRNLALVNELIEDQ
jgi:tetratricopeptide (TPR) repeat protein